MVTASPIWMTPSPSATISTVRASEYAPRSRISGRRLSSSGCDAEMPHRPGMKVKAIMPLPMMPPMAIEASSALHDSTTPKSHAPSQLGPDGGGVGGLAPNPSLFLARTALSVEMELKMISGAAEPNAMKEAPATSSRTFHRTHSVSRLTTRCSSATMPTAVNAYARRNISTKMPKPNV
jgi:hypothetical protein